MAGKFELYKDTAGKHRFRLKASNGQIIASGEAYESRASALKGIESVRKNAPTPHSTTRQPDFRRCLPSARRTNRPTGVLSGRKVGCLRA